ncbi:MAG: hypothetical protein ACW99H_09570, partial [Candidatus Thorarchaeota archaeon]
MGMWLGGSNFRVVIPILFVLMVSCGTAEGISNHGLAWGIEVGDRFDYHYSYRSSDPSNSEDLDYYVVVDSLPEIPVDITELPQVSSSSTNEMNEYFSFYLMNGT